MPPPRLRPRFQSSVAMALILVSVTICGLILTSTSEEPQGIVAESGGRTPTIPASISADLATIKLADSELEAAPGLLEHSEADAAEPEQLVLLPPPAAREVRKVSREVERKAALATVSKQNSQELHRKVRTKAEKGRKKARENAMKRMERGKKEAHHKIVSGVEALKKKEAKATELHNKALGAQRERVSKKGLRQKEQQTKRLAGFQELQHKKTAVVAHEVDKEIKGKGVKKHADHFEKKVAAAANALKNGMLRAAGKLKPKHPLKKPPAPPPPPPLPKLPPHPPPTPTPSLPKLPPHPPRSHPVTPLLPSKFKLKPRHTEIPEFNLPPRHKEIPEFKLPQHSLAHPSIRRPPAFKMPKQPSKPAPNPKKKPERPEVKEADQKQKTAQQKVKRRFDKLNKILKLKSHKTPTTAVKKKTVKHPSQRAPALKSEIDKANAAAKQAHELVHKRMGNLRNILKLNKSSKSKKTQIKQPASKKPKKSPAESLKDQIAKADAAAKKAKQEEHAQMGNVAHLLKVKASKKPKKSPAESLKDQIAKADAAAKKAKQEEHAQIGNVAHLLKVKKSALLSKKTHMSQPAAKKKSKHLKDTERKADVTLKNSKLEAAKNMAEVKSILGLKHL